MTLFAMLSLNIHIFIYTYIYIYISNSRFSAELRAGRPEAVDSNLRMTRLLRPSSKKQSTVPSNRLCARKNRRQCLRIDSALEKTVDIAFESTPCGRYPRHSSLLWFFRLLQEPGSQKTGVTTFQKQNRGLEGLDGWTPSVASSFGDY